MIVSRAACHSCRHRRILQNKKSENDLTELVELMQKFGWVAEFPPAPENPTPLEAMSPRLAFEP